MVIKTRLEAGLMFYGTIDNGLSKMKWLFPGLQFDVCVQRGFLERAYLIRVEGPDSEMEAWVDSFKAWTTKLQGG